MTAWKTIVQPSSHGVRLLMSDPLHDEILKARLPAYPHHPRALLSLLEALSLWVGQPLTTAISAEHLGQRRCVEALFGDGLLPHDSALVRFETLPPTRRRRTLPGVGDFRQLRLLLGKAP